MTSINICFETWEASISCIGAGLQGLTLDGHAITTSYSVFEQRIGAEGDVLAPFPGRINNGQYVFDGETHHLHANERAGMHAIHGFVRMLPWHVVAQSNASVTLNLKTSPVAGYPFQLDLTITYALNRSGLTVSTKVRNDSDVRAPFGIGYHAYFVVGTEFVDQATLSVPFSHVLEFDQLIPTGNTLPVDELGVNFTNARPIGETVIDNCFTKGRAADDGLVYVILSGPERSLSVWMDPIAYPYCVVFTADTLVESRRRKALAIEPMSCASDGFNHPEWPMTILESHSEWSGSWGISALIMDTK